MRTDLEVRKTKIPVVGGGEASRMIARTDLTHEANIVSVRDPVITVYPRPRETGDLCGCMDSDNFIPSIFLIFKYVKT